MKTLLLLIGLTSLAWSVERTQVHMGTYVSVRVANDAAADAVFERFAVLERLLSTYRDDSEISRLGRGEAVAVSPLTRRVLERSLEMNRYSGGAFDITIGSLTHDAYRFGYADATIPTEETISEGIKRIGSDRIRIFPDRVEVTLGTKIDLGGIGKGYAVDVAAETLRDRGIREGLIAASGDIACLGSCEVMIADPFHPEGTVARITSTLPRLAVSTSGNYERYVRSKQYNHLLDPKTGKPQQRFASITLVDTTDNTRIDALATAVSVMEEEAGIAMLGRLGIGYILIRNDGIKRISPLPEGIRLSWKGMEEER